MNFIKNNWTLIVIVLLAAFLTFGGSVLFDVVKDNRRLKDNMEQSMLDLPSKVLNMTKQEFNKYQAHNDSLFVKLRDSLKIRNVTRVINNKYYNSYDTTITIYKDNVDSTYKNFKHIFDPCVSVSGKINWEKDIIQFDSLVVDYNSTSVYYQKRKHNWWIFHLGRKRQWVTTTNNCTGETEVLDIEFEKQK